MEAEKTNAKAVIFAGGVGTRMWPVSRSSYPKQFEKIIDGKSTIQLTVDHLRPEFSYKNIYVSTNVKYVSIIRKQLPLVPSENIIGEPERKDVAPAVGYLMSIMEKIGDDPTVILWSDHIRNNLKEFKKMLVCGQIFIRKNPDRFLFVGEKPRFANDSLGWIQIGNKIKSDCGMPVFEFEGLKYQPDRLTAEKYFTSGKNYWNPGYWIVKPSLVMDQYRRQMPDMYKKLVELGTSWGKPDHSKKLKKIYPTLEKISFDNAILEKMDPRLGVVIVADMGWADVGTWQALKEVLQKNPRQNVTHGKTFLFDSENNLVYNYSSKLLATAGLKDTIVVATQDAIMVCGQDAMTEVKKMVEGLAKNKELKKYT